MENLEGEILKRTRVILESPYRGRNLVERAMFEKYLDLCIRDSVHRQEAPFASHKMYPGALDEDDPDDRDAGIHCGYEWWQATRRIIFYIDYGYSDGMKAARKWAEQADFLIEERRLYDGTDKH